MTNAFFVLIVSIPWIILGFLFLAFMALRGSPDESSIMGICSINAILISIALYLGIKKKGLILIVAIINSLIISFITIFLIFASYNEQKGDEFRTCGGAWCDPTVNPNLIKFFKEEGVRQNYTLITNIDDVILKNIEGDWCYSDSHRWAGNFSANFGIYRMRTDRGHDMPLRISSDNIYLEEITRPGALTQVKIYITSKGIFYIYNNGYRYSLLRENCK